MTSFGKTVVGAIIIIAVIIGGFYYYQYSKTSRVGANTDGTVCTMDAKLCPDGSYVGRTGPNCEFAACPGSELETFTGGDITFTYPENLGTEYVTAIATDWPPKVEVEEQTFTCSEGGSENSLAGRTSRETINGTTYCVTKKSEGAAGSTYSQYTYAFAKGSDVVRISFGLQFINCGNYTGEEMTACALERNSSSVHEVIDRIASSVTIRL